MTNKTELEIEYLEMFEKYVHEIETNRLESSNYKDNVHNLLRSILEFYQGDRAYVIEVDWDLNLGSNTFELCGNGIKSQMERLQDFNMTPFSRWEKASKTKEFILSLDIEDLINTEKEEYEMLYSQEIRNLIVVPLRSKVSGFLGIDNPKRFCDKPNFLRAMSYAVASEVKEHNLSNTNKQKMTSYPVKAENEIVMNFCGGFEIITPLGAMSEMSIKSDLTCQLLSYLYFNRNQKISNSRLIEVLWEFETSDNPLQSLRQLVYRSKKILSPILENDIICSTPMGYELNPKYTIKSDIRLFEELCSRGNEANDITDKLDYYYRAINLYKNSFLPRYEHLSWVMNYSTFLHGMFVYAVKCCVNELKKSESYLEIYRIVNNALQYDLEDGELNYALIEALVKQRNFSRATRHYYRKIHLFSEEQKYQFERSIAFFG